MPIPTKRLVISKEHGITTEEISRTTEKSSIFTKQKKKIGVMKFLSRRSNLKKRKASQRRRDLKTHRPFKHHKTKGSSFQFRRIETLVKNKHSQMKHWSLSMQRRKNPKYRHKLQQQLRGVDVLLIVRIHRKKNVPKKILRKMRELGLLKPWDCVIIRKTASLQLVLRSILPFITFGAPSREVIRDLILKRGRLVNDGNRAVIKSNVIVERVLGEYGVICVEDMIDALAITTEDKEDKFVMMNDGTKLLKTDRFDAIANALNPFALNTITIPMRGLKCPFNHLGYWGYRGTYINTFVEKIL
eukprot:169853_1